MQQEDLARGLAEVEAGWEEAVRRRAKREEKRERRERLFREIEGIEGFEEARALGILYAGGTKGGTSYSAGQGAVGIDRELAVAAFRRAYSIDPRRRTKAGGERLDPGLFEVPTRLGGVYRAMGEPDEAAKVYRWVLSHHDSRCPSGTSGGEGRPGPPRGGAGALRDGTGEPPGRLLRPQGHGAGAREPGARRGREGPSSRGRPISPTTQRTPRGLVRGSRD